MVQKSGFHQLRLVIYPMIYEVLHIPYTSLLVQDFFQQQYDLMQWFSQPEIPMLQKEISTLNSQLYPLLPFAPPLKISFKSGTPLSQR